MIFVFVLLLASSQGGGMDSGFIQFLFHFDLLNHFISLLFPFGMNHSVRKLFTGFAIADFID